MARGGYGSRTIGGGRRVGLRGHRSWWGGRRWQGVIGVLDGGRVGGDGGGEEGEDEDFEAGKQFC